MPKRKAILQLGALVFVFLFTFVVTREVGKRQLFQKRAAGGFVDEIPPIAGDHNLQYINGVLISQDAANQIAKQSITTQASVGVTGSESRLTLPSISAFSSSLYSGTAEVSYPIATFPGLGGLTPSLSLGYSSAAVDDLHLYRGMWDKSDYEAQAGIAGLGWDIGGVGFVARDNTTNPNTFSLVFAGGSTKLFRVDETSNLWQSNPKLFVKIYHSTNTSPSTKGTYYDTNTWQVTTQDGTVYTFGSQLNETPNTDIPVGAPVDEAMTPLTIAKDTGDCQPYNYNKYTPYKWYLREVNDLNGNKLTYEYIKDQTGNYYGACSQDKGFTTATYLKRVKYNYVNNDAKTVIDLAYEGTPETPRPDYRTLDWLKFMRGDCKAEGLGEDYCNSWAGMIQFRVAYQRLKQISVTVNSQLARKYVLDYDLSQGSGDQKTLGGFRHPGHSLLKSITQYGTDGNSPLPAYAFTYEQGSDLNSVYLKTTSNGYGGVVTYDEYKDYNVEFCASNKICDGMGIYGSTRHVVTKTTSTDGEGNSFQKTYEYENPKAYVKTQINRNTNDDCNACYDFCKTLTSDADKASCNAYCNNFYKSQDKCGSYTEPFTGFEFLGFANSTEKLFGLNNPSKVESSSKSYFYQSIEKDTTCFKPDPRKGRPSQIQSLDASGNVLTTSEMFYEPSTTTLISQCNSDPKTWEKESIFVKQTQTNNIQSPPIGTKITATKTFYNDQWGIVGRVENWGEVTFSNVNDHTQIQSVGDKAYSFTFYTYNPEKWIVKPRQTYASNAVAADGINGVTKYNNTQYFYDNNTSTDDKVAPTYGLLTKKTLNDDSYSPAKIINTTYQYNLNGNGQLWKTIDQKGGTSEITYDSIIGVFPTAVKNAKGHTTTTEYIGKDYALGLPTVNRDIAGRMSKTDYDVFGRITNSYQPDSTNPTITETTPIASYKYYDALKKPYVRITKRIYNSNTQTTDQIYNGFGWLLQNQLLSTFIDVDGNGVTQEKGIVSEVTYDSLGRKIEVGNPIIVDSRGITADPVKLAVSSPERTKTVYDMLGRTVSVTDPLTRTSTTTYNNFQTTVTDPAGQTSVSKTDGLGRTVFASSYQGNFGAGSGKPIEVTTTYDTVGNPLTVTQNYPDNADIKTLTSTTTYDRSGRKLQTSDPDLGTWKYAYDTKGRLLSQTDAKNQIITFDYDLLDRVIKKSYPGKPYLEALNAYVEYKYDNATYNALDKLWQMNDLTGSTQNEYDKKGRISKMTKTISNAITGSSTETAVYIYTYYTTDQIKSVQNPDGEVLNYTYDKYGNQQGLSSNKGLYLTSTSTNRFGSPTKTVFGNGFNQTFTYDNVNRLRMLTAADNTTILMEEIYNNRDVLNNITDLSQTFGDNTSENLRFTYDSLSQLKSVSGGTSNYTYDADELGNLKVKTEDNTVNMTYNQDFPAHAPKTVTVQENGFTYKYDANGNLIEDEARTYQYDYDNKPILITVKAIGFNPGSSSKFYYDGNGERVTKKVTTVTTPTATPLPGPTATPIPCPRREKGNLNCDLGGLIDSADLEILKASWTRIPFTTDSPTEQRRVDITNDLLVDELDLSIMLSNWGYGTVTPTTVLPTATPVPVATLTPAACHTEIIAQTTSNGSYNLVTTYPAVTATTGALVQIIPSFTGKVQKIEIKAGMWGTNTGTLTCKLQDSSGTILGETSTASFNSSSGVAFRQLNFPTAMNLTQNTTYTLYCRRTDGTNYGAYWNYNTATQIKTYQMYMNVCSLP